MFSCWIACILGCGPLGYECFEAFFD